MILRTVNKTNSTINRLKNILVFKMASDEFPTELNSKGK